MNNKVPLKPVLKRKQGQQHTYNPNVKSTIIDIKKTHSAPAKIITENPLDNIPLDNKGPRVVQNTKQGKSNIAAGPSVNIVEPKNSKVIHPIRAKRISKQIEKAIPGIQVKTIVAPLEALLNNWKTKQDYLSCAKVKLIKAQFILPFIQIKKEQKMSFFHSGSYQDVEVIIN